MSWDDKKNAIKGTETINRMLNMQRREYDALVFKAHGMSNSDRSYKVLWHTIDLALAGELGELNHELNADWCWWKFGQKPVNRKAALKEFADVIYFCLMEMLARGYNDKTIYNKLLDVEYHFASWTNRDTKLDVLSMIDCMHKQSYIGIIFVGMKMFNLNWDDVFEIYRKKNKINIQRVQDGY